MPYSGGSATGQMNLDRVESGLTALIERGGWWAQRASEGHPYTIGTREMKVVRPRVLRPPS
ncbi:MAG: hypothetical protein JO031_13325 [Ktedonobacteraceae bacterium]|nr:hypothetical protein [Ktedonobacteraceae bacterium]